MEDSLAAPVENDLAPAGAEAQAPLPPGLSHVVGIGASAGGLEALERLFNEMPSDTGMAFVVIQHLSPDFKSLMDELLARHTRLSIYRVEDGMEVQPNSIYLIPPKKEMIISAGRLLLTDKDPSQGFALPIDIFFRSLAQDLGSRAVAIVLSGTGSDGSRGIRDVHAAGGLIIVQSQESAKFDGMPRSAIDTGAVDLILPPEQIPQALLQFTKRDSASETKEPPEPTPADKGIEAVFRLLRKAYGIDFSHYKPSTVARRIERRLLLNQFSDLEAYVDRVAGDEAELNALYRDLLIGVTSFFRDPEAFERLGREVIAPLIASAKPDEELRFWVAGCATGEEAYSLAILVDEQLAAAHRANGVRIFATDVHRESLNVASVGVYPESSLAAMAPRRLGRYFHRKGTNYQVTPELRKTIVFAPHNVLKDAPFTKLDLVTCRNLLIYFQPLAQKKVLSLFHFGLKTGGVLFLGPSETPGELTDEFDAIDPSWKLYRKRRDCRLPHDLRMPIAPANVDLPTGILPFVGGPQAQVDQLLLRAYDALLEQVAAPSILVNNRRELVHVFGGAGKYLSLRDGRPTSDLLEMVTESLRVPLSGAMQRAMRTDAQTVYHGVPISTPRGEQTLKLTVRPLARHGRDSEFFLISIEETPDQPTTPRPPSAAGGEHVSQEQMQSLETELQYTKENLQAAIEEMETSNEELQATNEELVASNEELQSTNEELHSVNEELYTVNAEYQRKIVELTELNADMDHLFQSTEVGTVFLDRSLCIRKFTPRVARVFNLLPQDIGRPLDGFAHRLAYDSLIDDIRRVAETGTRFEHDVQDQSGDWYLLRILPYHAKGRIDGVVVTLIDVGRLKQTEGQLRRMSKVFMDGADPIIIEDLAGHIVDLNTEAEVVYGWKREELVGQPVSILVPPAERDESAELRRRCRSGERVQNVESIRCSKDGKVQPVLLTLSLLTGEDGKPLAIATIAKDISHQKAAEAVAREGVERRDHFLAMLSHELRNPLGAVLTATHVLEQANVDRGTMDRACHVIQAQARQMARLLDDLLDVSRMTQGKIEMRRQVIELTALVSDAVAAARPAVDSRNQELTVEVGGGPLWVDGDPSRLLQIQGNLLANASKYTPRGGRIWLSVGREGNQAVIRVRDNGVGIPADMREAIFELFVQSDQTLDRSDGGMGVGLTLVRTLVQMHGGTVEVLSDGPGCGSEFVVRLPITEKSPRKLSDEKSSPALGAGLRVAIVEDNSASREMLKSLLELSGLCVTAVGDGASGADMIVDQTPDLAFVDVGLPEVDGYEVARRVRQRAPKGTVYLVALTGYGSSDDRRAAVEAGFDEHLIKPLRMEDLQRVLNTVQMRRSLR